MAIARPELESQLHRLANYLECQLSDVIHDLLVDSRVDAVSSLAWSGAQFIETLREVRDGKQGGAV